MSKRSKVILISAIILFSLSIAIWLIFSMFRSNKEVEPIENSEEVVIVYNTPQPTEESSAVDVEENSSSETTSEPTVTTIPTATPNPKQQDWDNFYSNSEYSKGTPAPGSGIYDDDLNKRLYDLGIGKKLLGQGKDPITQKSFYSTDYEDDLMKTAQAAYDYGMSGSSEFTIMPIFPADSGSGVSAIGYEVQITE